MEFLAGEGLAQKGLSGQFALSQEGFSFQCLLFLAFPFYVMMATEFGAYGERLRREFVKALIELALGGGDRLSHEELAEIERVVVTTFDEYNVVWQSGASGGEIMRRLGAVAFERILG